MNPLQHFVWKYSIFYFPSNWAFFDSSTSCLSSSPLSSSVHKSRPQSGNICTVHLQVRKLSYPSSLCSIPRCTFAPTTRISRQALSNRRQIVEDALILRQLLFYMRKGPVMLGDRVFADNHEKLDMLLNLNINLN